MAGDVNPGSADGRRVRAMAEQGGWRAEPGRLGDDPHDLPAPREPVARIRRWQAWFEENGPHPGDDGSTGSRARPRAAPSRTR